MQEEVRRGLSRLARARETITVDEAVLSGTPCVKGTRHRSSVFALRPT